MNIIYEWNYWEMLQKILYHSHAGLFVKKCKTRKKLIKIKFEKISVYFGQKKSQNKDF